MGSTLILPCSDRWHRICVQTSQIPSGLLPNGRLSCFLPSKGPVPSGTEGLPALPWAPSPSPASSALHSLTELSWRLVLWLWDTPAGPLESHGPLAHPQPTGLGALSGLQREARTLGGAHEPLSSPSKIGLGWLQRGWTGVYFKLFHVETLMLPLYWGRGGGGSKQVKAFSLLADFGQSKPRNGFHTPPDPTSPLTQLLGDPQGLWSTQNSPRKGQTHLVARWGCSHGRWGRSRVGPWCQSQSQPPTCRPARLSLLTCTRAAEGVWRR